MKEKIYEVLEDVNEDIISYNGKNMMLDGVTDSFEIIEIVARLEEAFHIEIDARDVVETNFLNKDTIVKLIEHYCG